MSAAIVCAFLLGNHFGSSRTIESQKTETPRVFIEQQKTQIKVTKNREDIEIFLDGNKLEESYK